RRCDYPARLSCREEPLNGCALRIVGNHRTGDPSNIRSGRLPGAPSSSAAADRDVCRINTPRLIYQVRRFAAANLDHIWVGLLIPTAKTRPSGIS
ncbi:MAG: hypothetical protein ACREDR_34725, partial [Blastocatellia bacterium]